MIAKLGTLMLKMNDAVLSSKRHQLIKTYGVCRELCTYAFETAISLRVKKSSTDTQFIIYCQGRTGSTLLVDLLNSHPKIHCDREIFAVPPVWEERFIQAKRAIYANRTYGCKILGHQLESQVGTDNMSKFLEQMSAWGWRIIYLVRENSFRQALSYVLIEQGSKRHLLVEDQDDDAPKPTVDIASLRDRLATISEEARNDKILMSKVDHLEFCYERDLLNSDKHQKTVDRVFSYLGLESVPVQTKYRRISKDCLSDFIANAEEVKHLVNSTPLQEIKCKEKG